MSGLEIAGVLLGVFPLVISGLEHWRDVAKVGGFYWRIRKEYSKCRSDILYHEILYKRNLKDLLLPLVDEPSDITRLISNPDAEKWKDKVMQERLKERLKESYTLYMDIVVELKETTDAFKKELAIGDHNVQAKLDPSGLRAQQRLMSPQPQNTPSKMASAKAKWDYEKFRIKFSFNEAVRVELVRQLEKCNQRLKELLRTSESMPAAVDDTEKDRKNELELEKIFKRLRKRSRLLFIAIQRSWQCVCQPDHYIHLRLEHRRRTETCFEIILTSTPSATNSSMSWSWKELRCGDVTGCSGSGHLAASSGKHSDIQQVPAPLPQTLVKPKRVAFESSNPRLSGSTITSTSHDLELCRALGMDGYRGCMGILSEGEESYHLHQSKKRRRPSENDIITLEKVIADRTLARDQRYLIALLLASSVAQLQETPWLTTGLRKENVFFYPCEDSDCGLPYHEPFIRQGFVQFDPTGPDAERNDCNFYSLGILLLELCFAQRLEDHPYRKRYSVGEGKEKDAFDRVAALDWSHDVLGEGGHEYASAVSWCFTTKRDRTQTWQSAIIKNVIRPLEVCQEHFKTAIVTC